MPTYRTVVDYTDTVFGEFDDYADTMSSSLLTDNPEGQIHLAGGWLRTTSCTATTAAPPGRTSTTERSLAGMSMTQYTIYTAL